MSLEVAAVHPNLDNCAQEPIHIPGSIQPHGALLAVDRQGLLLHASVNVPELLGLQPVFGAVLPLQFPNAQDGSNQWGLVQSLIDEVRAACAIGDMAPMSDQVTLAGRAFDVVVHASHELIVCEFEQRLNAADNTATFPQKAHRSMDALKRQRSEVKLLEVAAAAVRELTGFDRVMAYRFRHDDSGDVVAEACDASLEPYLGRRYPASDIPAQARRLYTINTLRLIGDVDYTPVPLMAAPGHTAPLDLSHSVLRSVSPIHVEYLQNMGVKASMSVSIVVAGKLWGMLACHHMSPHQVPYSVRMAADVIAQLLASSVQSLAAQTREARLARTAWLGNDITLRIAQRQDVRQVLADAAPALCESLACDAMVVLLDDKLAIHGDVQEAWALGLADWLKTQPAAVVHVHRADQWPVPPMVAEGAHHFGVLALRFDAHQQGWLVGLRREQVQTIRWGGRPEKVLAVGPLGPRLTPRGSFDEWRETVRDTAEPWDETELYMASQLLDAVSRAHADRLLELDRLRSQLWAVLGHDLRNPLASLSVAAQVLNKRGDPTGRMNSVISRSATRMERLLRDVLDISAIQNGLGLSLERKNADLVSLIQHQIEDLLLAHPEMKIEQRLPAELRCQIDPSRIGQVLDNLLSNARHHGDGIVEVRADQAGHEVVLEVRNPSAPIPPDVVRSLFDPFKRQAGSNPRNSTGMGLGLYIAHQIAGSHGGTLAYRHADGAVIFELRLPVHASTEDAAQADPA